MKSFHQGFRRRTVVCALQLLRTSRSWYASHPKEAGQMVPGEIPAGITKVECASYAATVRVILNLDEFLTRN